MKLLMWIYTILGLLMLNIGIKTENRNVYALAIMFFAASIIFSILNICG